MITISKNIFIFSVGLFFLVACATTENEKTNTTFPDGSLSKLIPRLKDRTSDDKAVLTIINGRCAALNKVVSNVTLQTPEHQIAEPLYELSQMMGKSFLILARQEGSVVSDYEIRSNEALYTNLLVSSPEAFQEDFFVCVALFEIIAKAVSN